MGETKGILVTSVHYRPEVWLLALAMSAACPAKSQAQQPVNNDWIGKRVVQKDARFKLQVESQVIDTKSRIATYRVEQANGPWLWLRAAEVSGWALADQVVPVEDAIAFFTDHIRANPVDPHGYTMRAIIWRVEKKEFDIALADHNEAIRLAPTEAYVYTNRGVTWHAKKEFDKVIADCNEAIRLDPKHTSAYLLRGSAWMRKKEYNKALHDLNEAVRLTANSAQAYLNRAVCWTKLHQYDKTIADTNEAIRLEPKYGWAYHHRGLAHYKLRDYEKAIADFGEAIRLDAKDAWSCARLAWLILTCRVKAHEDWKRALELAERACSLADPKDGFFFNVRAATLSKMGRFEEAAKWQEQALSTPTDEIDHDESAYERRLQLYKNRQPFDGGD